MGGVLLSFHTHAKGGDFGWWGVQWHPSHFDENMKEIPNTGWKFEVHDAEMLDDARRSLFEQWLHNRDNLFPTHEHETEGL